MDLEPRKFRVSSPCNKVFTVADSLTCWKTGHTYIRWSPFRDAVAKFWKNMGQNIEVKGLLQLLQDEIFEKNSATQHRTSNWHRHWSIWSLGWPFQTMLLFSGVLYPLRRTSKTSVSCKVNESLQKLEKQQRILIVERDSFFTITHSPTQETLFSCNTSNAKAHREDRGEVKIICRWHEPHPNQK